MRKKTWSLSIVLVFSLLTAIAQVLPEDFPTFRTAKYGDTGEGFIFLSVSTDEQGIGYYVMMIDDEGHPFKYRKLDKDDYAYDFKVQPNGLTSFAQFLSHHDYTGGGNCIHMIMDEEMSFVDSFQLGNGYIAEAHDFQLLPNGHALAFGYYLTEMDLSEIVDGGYPNALVSGGVVQELDADKNVIWQWRSWDHYDPENYEFGRRSNRQTVSEFHLNTINLDTDDNLLLATPSWTKKIDRRSGKILWHLGGWENEFSFVGVDSLEGVSDVTGHAFYRLENGNYLIYDNGPRRGEGTSEAHEYRIDEVNKIAEKIMTFTPDTAIAAWHRGNAQRLPNGNTLVGWGGASGDHIPTCTEFDAQGNEVLKVWFNDPVTESYRAVRFPYPPSHQYEADIIEVALGNTYEVKQGDTLAIGITVEVTDLITAGYSELNFTTHEYAPRFPEFSGRAPMVLPRRVHMEGYNVNYVNGEIRFHIDSFGITNPDSITLYQRMLDGPDTFEPLATAYNPVTRELIADFTDLGEFIFTYPDIQHGQFAPLTVYPSEGEPVNYRHPVHMEWSPQGFYHTFRLQLASDASFNDLLLDSAGLHHTILDRLHPTVNDTVFWRVKTLNDAGESAWSDTSWFVTRAPYIRLTSPNGNEIWQRGRKHFIRWEDNLGEEVVLALYHEGEQLVLIDTVESRSAFQWDIPFDLDSACSYHIKIRSVKDTSIHDVSTLTFSLNDSVCSNVTVADVKVLSPNGGEVYQPGDTLMIEWDNSTGESLTVDLYHEGTKLETLAEGAAEESMFWIIPAEAGPDTSYRIVLTSEGAEPMVDASNADFSIVASTTGLARQMPVSPGFHVFPNPAGRSITIQYYLKQAVPAEFRIYHLTGREIEVIRRPASTPGTKVFRHKTADYAPGTYIIRFVSGQEISSTLLLIQ